MYFSTAVCFKTLEKESPVDPDKICEEIFLNLDTSCWEEYFESYVSLELSYKPAFKKIFVQKSF